MRSGGKEVGACGGKEVGACGRKAVAGTDRLISMADLDANGMEEVVCVHASNATGRARMAQAISALKKCNWSCQN